MSHTDICMCIFIWLENVMPIKFLVFQLHALLGFRLLSHMHGMQERDCYSDVYKLFFNCPIEAIWCFESVLLMKLWKWVKETSFKMESGSPEGGALRAVSFTAANRPQQEEKTALTLQQAADCLQPMKNHHSPPQFPPSLYKSKTLSSLLWTCLWFPIVCLSQVAISLLFLKITHFVGKITGSFAFVKSTKPTIVFIIF